MTTQATGPASAAPFTLAPALLDKVWGGDRLARFNKPVAPGARVGESWELADMASTSASGAGGGAQRSRISSGPLAGLTLHDALERWGAALLGTTPRSEEGGFPLLVKFLDAREHLSVQVHPSPAYAAAHAGAKLKTECWYILDALPGAVIYKGLKPGVTLAQLREAIVRGDVPAVMQAVPAAVGDCHNLPSGTVHALGAGVLAAEVQTPSDTTFRVYDWEKELGRKGREMHVEQALACILPDAPPAARRLGEREMQTELVTTPFFRVFEHRVAGNVRFEAGRCQVVTVLSGEARLRWGGTGNTGEETLALPLGQTAVIPAALASDTALSAQNARVLRTLLP